MSSFGKIKYKGLKLARKKKSSYLLKGRKRIITFTPGKSPFLKKQKTLSPKISTPSTKRSVVKSTPSKTSKKRLLYSHDESVVKNSRCSLWRGKSTFCKIHEENEAFTTLEASLGCALNEAKQSPTVSDFETTDIDTSEEEGTVNSPIHDEAFLTFEIAPDILIESDIGNTDDEIPECSSNLREQKKPWTFQIAQELLADLGATEVDTYTDKKSACPSPMPGNPSTFKMPQEILADLEVSEQPLTRDSSTVPQDIHFTAYDLSEDQECHQSCEDKESDDIEGARLQQELVELLPKVINEFKLNGKEEILHSFFKQVARKEFPFDNIAFLLWCDIVRWYSYTDSRQMRYTPECVQFFWVGKKLFGGRFVRFMTGMKNEQEFLRGETALDPQKSRLNFACPSENMLRDVNPVGSDMPLHYKPGILEPLIRTKANKDDSENSYVLMLDGKKIKRGTDVNLLGFEKNETLNERIEEKERKLSIVRECTEAVAKVHQKTMKIEDTSKKDKDMLLPLLLSVIQVFSLILKQVRQLRLKKNNYVNKLKEQSGEDWRASKYAFSIDAATTIIWKVDNLIDKIMKVIKCLYKSGAYLNHCGHIFADSDIVNLNAQANVTFLKSPELLPPDTDTALIKQRTARWHEDRQHMLVTGSSIYQAIGCDSLKRQKQHLIKL